MRMKFTYKFAQHKKQVFLTIAILAVVLIAGCEAFGLTHESTSIGGYFARRYTVDQPHIYSQGNLGSRFFAHRTATPVIHGKPYNVLYYKGGLVAPLATVYYYVPQATLDAEPGNACIAPKPFLYVLFRTQCTDPRRLPGAQRVAVIYSFIGVEIEVITVFTALIALASSYWWYFRK